MNFEVTVSQTVELSVSEVWPDGGAPENPTVGDVVKAMRDEQADPRELIHEWNLIDEPEITVTQGDSVAHFSRSGTYRRDPHYNDHLRTE